MLRHFETIIESIQQEIIPPGNELYYQKQQFKPMKHSFEKLIFQQNMAFEPFFKTYEQYCNLSLIIYSFERTYSTRLLDRSSTIQIFRSQKNILPLVGSPSLQELLHFLRRLWPTCFLCAKSYQYHSIQDSSNSLQSHFSIPLQPRLLSSLLVIALKTRSCYIF